MIVSIKEYQGIYSELHTCLYRIDNSLLSHLRKKDRLLLSKYGLPANCIEVLDFDNIATCASHELLENALFIFGSIYESMEESYIFINHENRIQLLLDNKLIFVNDDLEKFLLCHMEYVLFVDEMRTRNEVLGNKISMTEEDYFDIYYRLRAIDRASVRKDSLWHKFIFDAFTYERAIYEYDEDDMIF